MNGWRFGSCQGLIRHYTMTSISSFLRLWFQIIGGWVFAADVTRVGGGGGGRNTPKLRDKSIWNDIPLLHLDKATTCRYYKKSLPPPSNIHQKTNRKYRKRAYVFSIRRALSQDHQVHIIGRLVAGRKSTLRGAIMRVMFQILW